MKQFDAVVIGGGFYGSCIAILLAQHYDHVALFEKEQLPLANTSFAGFEIHNLYEFFMVFVVLCGIAAIILAVLSPRLMKMMHGVN